MVPDAEGWLDAATRWEARLARMAGLGPDADTLARLKAGMLAHVELERDDPPAALARLGEEWTVCGAATSGEALGRAISAVNGAEVRDALRAALAQATPFGWPRR
jgi:hypothetical protein